MLPFLKVGPNLRGRDFIIGDVHGAFDLVVQALMKVGYAPENDRIFFLGDLIDRGPKSLSALNYLDKPGIWSLRGNHEAMFMSLFAKGNPSENHLYWMTRENGMKWIAEISHNERMELLDRFRKLPIAIELETSIGPVGLVHAEVPEGMSWQEFTERLNSGDRALSMNALWSRNRIEAMNASGVPGIVRVFVGHSPLMRPVRLGNVIYIDTGAVFGLLAGEKEGRLTLADATAQLSVFDTEPPPGLIDIRCDPAPAQELDPIFGRK